MSAFQAVVARLDAYERLVRLDKPIGSLLLMWPTLWALWMAADGAPRLPVLLIFMLGTILMRSAGCAINDWADRDFDGAVERTKARPLAAGEIRHWEALIVGAVLALLAFLLILPLNTLTKLLSVPALFIAITYPFTKRFFAIPQAYLGLAFSFGIPMAYAATLNDVPMLAWVLLTGNFFWIMAYDTEYALADYPDDIKIGIRTSAITFGRHAVAAIVVSYALALGIFGWVGYSLQLGHLYYAGLVLAAGVAGYHYQLIRGRDRALCFKAFRHNNWFGFAVFAGVALDYALRLGAWPRGW